MIAISLIGFGSHSNEIIGSACMRAVLMPVPSNYMDMYSFLCKMYHVLKHSLSFSGLPSLISDIDLRLVILLKDYKETVSGWK